MKLISTATAAELIGVSVRRVAQFVKDGRLKSYSPHPRIFLLNEAEVKRFAKTPRVQGKKLR